MHNRDLECSRGEITIEASIVVVVVLFVLVAVISFGFLIYEQHNLRVTADNIAVKVAQTYTHPEADMLTGKYTVDPNARQELYSYISPNHIASLESANQSRAHSYGLSRLSVLSLASEVAPPTCTLKLCPDGFGRNHVEIRLTATYRVVGGSFFSLFGLPTTLEYHAVGRAECLDLMNYITTVNYTASLTRLTGLDSSKVVSAINTFMSLSGKLFGK